MKEPSLLAGIGLLPASHYHFLLVRKESWMSKVLADLALSADPIDREIANTLRIYQDNRAKLNLSRSIGYEPRDLRKHGSVEVIERRIRKQSSGFDMIPAEVSYESIVLKYPSYFKADIIAISSERISREEEAVKPTADPIELDKKVKELFARSNLPMPEGNDNPQKSAAISNVFLRDPKVKAFVLRRAGGRCECCETPAPFKTFLGLDYLEVHHMKTLAQGGSDRVQNAVALCPNCHRALHYGSNATELSTRIYSQVTNLIRE